jgi:hypothetical protein
MVPLRMAPRMRRFGERRMVMEAIDISSLNFHQLEELRTRAEQRVTEMRETGAPALREQWTEQAASIGMTVEEILQAGKKRGRGNGKQNADA